MTTEAVPAGAARVPLSRDRVLRTAIELADRDGIESLSMRSLARALGVEAMSLYNHVANKPDLLDAMVEAVVDGIWVPSRGDEWKSAMRRRAISASEVLARHPWAIGLIDASPDPSLDRLRYTEAILACLRASGFSVAMAVHAFFTLDSYIYGFVIQERSLPIGTAEEVVDIGEQMLQGLPANDFPALREVIVEYDRSGRAIRDEFEFGLELILDALERDREGV